MPTDASTLDNHKAYIQNWISVLEKDPNVLFAAIKDAEAISDYVLSHAPLALKEIKEHQKTNCADYVKKSVKDDFEHERISEKEYRKLLSKLRAHLKIVEKKMSAGEWNDIDFQSVPSYAMKKYRNAFKLKSEAFSDFMNKVKSGEQTIKADVLYPYDLVRSYIRNYGINSMIDDVIEAQWKALPDYLNGTESNVIVVADTSGSMFGCDRLPISSALGLAVYFAQRNKGAYHNLFMNFSSSPKFYRIPEESSLLSILRGVASADWGMNTDLESVFRQVLSLAIEEGVSAEEMPKAIVVVSDMEIDSCGRVDFVAAMEKLYESKGYKLPKLIFWNVNSRNDTFLTKDKNVLLVGGHATSTFKQLINSIDKTAFEFMEDVLMSERYAPVTLA
jgi:hypothetical protein